MNGIHDLGGMDGFGAIAPEADEPVFHADWEKRVFALASAIPFAVPYVDDHFRREIERTPPAEYLASTYYELWLHAIERLLIERGVLAQGELSRRVQEPGNASQHVPLQPGVVAADRVAATIAGGASTRREEGMPARFLPGDAVQARNIHPSGHTRLPRFVRGKRGVIHADHGVFVFADSNAAGTGEQPQHVYCVRFRARELWGEAAPETDRAFIDLWDEHLEPV